MSGSGSERSDVEEREKGERRGGREDEGGKRREEGGGRGREGGWRREKGGGIERDKERVEWMWEGVESGFWAPKCASL